MTRAHDFILHMFSVHVTGFLTVARSPALFLSNLFYFILEVALLPIHYCAGSDFSPVPEQPPGSHMKVRFPFPRVFLIYSKVAFLIVV